jgi:hypothetical protein
MGSKAGATGRSPESSPSAWPTSRRLTKSNAGVFPVQRVFEMVDGRLEVVGHGSRDMPVWGNDYNAKAPEWVGPFGNSADVEAWVRSRILALVEYVSTLQAR